MAGFGNLIWFVLGGFIWGIIWLILAGVFAITIIGLPIARACLEFAKLAAFPFGKAIIRDTELGNVSGVSKGVSTVLNIIWFPFGLIITILYFALALSCFVSIIGIPFGIAYVRMGKFSLFPMGARVVSKKQAYATAVANEIEKRNIGNVKQHNKKCRQCYKIYSGTSNACPYCNSSLYEETSQMTSFESEQKSASVDDNLSDGKDLSTSTGGNVPVVKKQGYVLAIVGLILGLLSLMIAFVSILPLSGSPRRIVSILLNPLFSIGIPPSIILGFLPGFLALIGLPLSIIGRSKLKLNGESTSIGTRGLVGNIGALCITIFLLLRDRLQF